jgi:hypothetical protein
MSKITITAALGLVLALGACRFGGIAGNGKITTEQRTISAFSEIEASGALQVEWQNGAPSLSITTDENLLSHISSEVIGERLRLRSHGNPWPTHGIKVLVSSPTRSGAQLSGATRLIANQLAGQKFAVESTGAAQVTLDGRVDTLLMETTGASKVNAGSLQTRSAEISTTGAAKVELAVSDVLKVSITGAGKVTYSGSPSTIEKHITGAGTIRHKE